MNKAQASLYGHPHAATEGMQLLAIRDEYGCSVCSRRGEGACFDYVKTCKDGHKPNESGYCGFWDYV